MNHITITGYTINKKIKNNNILRYKYEKIPCIIYGKKINIKIYIKTQEIKKIIDKAELNIIDLNLYNEKKTIKTIIKEIQRHPVNNKIMHIDFYKFIKSKKIEIKIPIKLIGRAIGVSKGGVLIKSVNSLKIKGLIDDIPNVINIDVNNLEIGDSLLLETIKNKNYEILDNDKMVLVSIKSPKTSNTKTVDKKE